MEIYETPFTRIPIRFSDLTRLGRNKDKNLAKIRVSIITSFSCRGETKSYITELRI